MSYADNKKLLPEGMNYETVHNWNEHFTAKLNELNKSGFTFLTFENTVFEDTVWFHRSPNFGTTFQNCYFKDDVTVTGNHEVRLEFRECFFDKNFTTNHSAVTLADLMLYQVSIKGKLSLVTSTIKSCWIVPVDVGSIELYSNQSKSIFIDGKEIPNNRVDRIAIGSLEGSFVLDAVNLNNLDVAGFNDKGDISVQNCQINKVNFYNYRNEGKLRFANISALDINALPSIFSLIKSYMGKAEFYNVDLASFKEVNMTDCYLVDCSFVNVKWSYLIRSWYGLHLIGKYPTVKESATKNKVNIIESHAIKYFFKRRKIRYDIDVIDYYKKSRETYRQLKHALSKQGDVINEQLFHAKEMMAYNRYISWGKNLGTKLIIVLSKYTSDFGQSIFLPILWLFVGHLILYSIALQVGAISVSCCGDLAYTFFALMNPVHPNNLAVDPAYSCFTISFSGYFILIDFAMRIVSSYMIYNIIRASRRFIK